MITTKNPKGAGRKRSEVHRDCLIATWITDKEYLAIKKAAKNECKSISSIVRAAINQSIINAKTAEK